MFLLEQLATSQTLNDMEEVFIHRFPLVEYEFHLWCDEFYSSFAISDLGRKRLLRAAIWMHLGYVDRRTKLLDLATMVRRPFISNIEQFESVKGYCEEFFPSETCCAGVFLGVSVHCWVHALKGVGTDLPRIHAFIIKRINEIISDTWLIMQPNRAGCFRGFVINRQRLFPPDQTGTL